jgi:hypothetical protein
MRMKRLHGIVAATLLSVAACGDDEDHSHDDAPGETHEELDALTTQLNELKGQLDKSIGDLAAAQEQLEAAQDRLAAGGDQAAVDAALHERDKLQGLLDLANAALTEAQAELDSQDYEEALEELAKAREALDKVTTARAQLPGSVLLDVDFMYGDAALELEKPYALAGGSFTFHSVRYWLSNVSLIRADGVAVPLENSYYALEARGELPIPHLVKPTTLPPKRREEVTLTGVPPATYKGIVFHVGVDPEHNDDLSKTGGELNVLTTLVSDSWMWFTSWIFTSTAASYVPTSAGEGDPAIAISWDNGTNADYREVQFDFAAPVAVDLVTQPTVALELQADKLIEGLDPEVDGFSVHPKNGPLSVIGASTAELRTTLADNWQAAFELKSASNTP